MMARFHLWMETHNRSYRTAEEKQRRFQVYASNIRYIETANAHAAAVGRSYELGEGPFTDLTTDESMATYTMPALSDEDDADEEEEEVITTRAGPVDGVGSGSELRLPTDGVLVSLSAGSPAPPPHSVDWREEGAVTPVKDQKHCRK